MSTASTWRSCGVTRVGKKLVSVTIRGEGKTWTFNFYADPEHISEWREDEDRHRHRRQERLVHSAVHGVAVARALASNPRRAVLQGAHTRRAAAAMSAQPVPRATLNGDGPVASLLLQQL